MVSRIRKSLSTVLIVFGLLCICIPLAADLLDSLDKKKQIEQTSAAALALTQKEKEKMLNQASSYNHTLLSDSPQFPLSEEKKKEYLQLLNINGDEIMGSISVPAIDVYLPVYHTTDDEVLSQGIGHLEGSSLPVGGTGTHAILFGHRGIPGSSLFTRLNELKTGDRIDLEILGDPLSYSVVQTEVLQPDDLSYCRIEPDRDLLTLVTCTPFGINNKRLIITASRTDSPKKTDSVSGFSKLSVIGLICCLVLLALFMSAWIIRKTRKKKANQPQTRQQKKPPEQNR